MPDLCVLHCTFIWEVDWLYSEFITRSSLVQCLCRQISQISLVNQDWLSATRDQYAYEKLITRIVRGACVPVLNSSEVATDLFPEQKMIVNGDSCVCMCAVV